MKIFLRGGKLDGQIRIIPECDRQFSEGGQVYKITDKTTKEGFPIFQFDETASRKVA
jgi:hypothetical protein